MVHPHLKVNLVKFSTAAQRLWEVGSTAFSLASSLRYIYRETMRVRTPCMAVGIYTYCHRSISEEGVRVPWGNRFGIYT
jgi:hypothetical protein